MAERNLTSPRSFSERLAPLASVQEWRVPQLDVDLLLAEDAANARLGLPYRVGLPAQVQLLTERDGSWDMLADGSLVWRLRVASAGARWMSVVFQQFALPEGVEVHFYSADGSLVRGPFTSADNQPDGVLALPHVPGDAAVLEMYVPLKVGGLPSLEVGSVVIGYLDLEQPPQQDAAQSCEVDINCPEGTDWQADKRSVARILFNGYLCTGTLLNTAPQDCKNYFLTANHCISAAADASACVFYWNYERPSCNSGSPSSQTQSGSVIKATTANSDVTLLELNAAPSSSFNTYRAGWTRTTTAASSVVGIHHPAGDVKKISKEYDPVVNGSYMGPNFWRVLSWDLGATEGGSSGSAIFNPSHQVVGQLWGGSSACPPPTTWDEYGKFSVSWDAGSSSATRLRDWLDPSNTGIVSIGGKESSTCSAPVTCATCPSQDFGPFTPASTYATHASSIVSGGCKLYAFSVTNGCTYRFSFCEGGGSATWDTVLDQLTGGCGAGATNDDSCSLQSQLDYTATATGTIYLKVRGYDSAAYGNYTLAYKQVSCPAACVTCPSYDYAITPGTKYKKHSASIASGGCRVYRISVTNGVRYRFSFCEGGGAVTWNTVLDQLSASCAAGSTNDDYCGTSSQLDFTATSTGYIYVKVRGATTAAYGNYTLAYRRY